MCLEVRLKQWNCMKRYSSFFILKGLLEGLQVVTSFVSSSSYVPYRSKTQISVSYSRWNAASWGAQTHCAQRWFAQLMLKTCSVKAEPLGLYKLQLNFRGKVMVLPWKMCHGPASLSEHLGEVWGMLEIVPKSLWFCKVVAGAGYHCKMEVHWLQPRSSRHSSWSSHSAIGPVLVDLCHAERGESIPTHVIP